MLIRLAAACALLTPAIALAQVQPVTVEVVATGEIDAPANSVTITANFLATAEKQADADKARDSKLGAMMAALQAQGVGATAVTELPENDMSRMMAATDTVVTTVEEASDDTDSDTEAQPVPPQFTAPFGKSIRLTSMAQYEAVKTALEKLDITLGEPVAELDNQPVVYRQAKAKALRNARADADAYAKEMGLRVARISRISEAGSNLFLPGLQDKFQRAITQGPAGMKDLFKSKPGFVHVEASIIVTFEMTP